MIPLSYHDFFSATATASAALIGLLFVAITLRSETVVGPQAEAAGQRLAASSFSSLVDTFFVSLVALLPGSGVGYVVVVMGALSLYSGVTQLRRLIHTDLHWALLALSTMSTLTFLYQVVLGGQLILAPHDRGLVEILTSLLIAELAIALVRAWALLQGRHLPGSPPPP